MPDDAAQLVMGDSNACFDAVVDLGLRPAVTPLPGSWRTRQRLLRTAIDFIQRQHGSGSPWACYVAPAGAGDVFDARGGKPGRGRPVKLM
jgi:hypothetical protein